MIRALVGDDSAFTPEDIALLAAAFEETLRRLGLRNREDPATTFVAKAIIQLAKHGVRDPRRLSSLCLQRFHGDRISIPHG